ncbi:integral membrane sensor signal transduction histidine kinase [Actinobacteria bacterium OK074]|nr:integral membrane sensor signal transduction histidine kinase [Actinobacteria bacterium OK074]
MSAPRSWCTVRHRRTAVGARHRRAAVGALSLTAALLLPAGPALDIALSRVLSHQEDCAAPRTCGYARPDRTPGTLPRPAALTVATLRRGTPRPAGPAPLAAPPVAAAVRVAVAVPVAAPVPVPVPVPVRGPAAVGTPAVRAAAVRAAGVFRTASVFRPASLSRTAPVFRTTAAFRTRTTAAFHTGVVEGRAARRLLAVDGGRRAAGLNSLSALRDRCPQSLLQLALLLVPLLGILGLVVQLWRDRDHRRQNERRLLEFLATAGHELRTPLTAISGYVQLARLGGLADPEKFDLAMDRMTDETRRMSALIDELVLLARLDLGQPLRREPVNLARLCRDAVADAQACSPRHPIRLTILPGNHMVTGDADRLYQAVANLLANVRHHTPEGTRTRLGLGTEDGHRVIEVMDDGPGIPAELRETVFQRFVHGDQRATPVPAKEPGGGNGLGLSVVSAIVAAHGGTVTLAPGGRGAWFRIRLPA